MHDHPTQAAALSQGKLYFPCQKPAAFDWVQPTSQKKSIKNHAAAWQQETL